MKENTIKAALAAALGALCAYGVQLLVPVPVLVLVVVMLLDYATGMVKRCAESDAWRADIHNCVHTNAEKMLDRLKKAGFSGFIVQGKK